MYSRVGPHCLYLFCTGFALGQFCPFHAASCSIVKLLIEASLRHTCSAVSIVLACSLLDFTSFWLPPLEAPPLCLLAGDIGNRERCDAPAVYSGLHSLPRDGTELRGWPRYLWLAMPFSL